MVLIGSSTSSSGSPPTQTRKRAYALIRRKNQHGQRLGLMLIWDIPKHEEIWDPELINETNSQHEAKRKKFQNQDSVISEKFASKVKHHTMKNFRGKLFFYNRTRPKKPRMAEHFVFPSEQRQKYSLSTQRNDLIAAICKFILMSLSYLINILTSHIYPFIKVYSLVKFKV